MGLRGLLIRGRKTNAPELARVPVSPAASSEREELSSSARPVRTRVAAWIDLLQRDPEAENRVAAERRALLLQELNRTVADAPDDVPIKYVIERLNRHWDD